MFTSTIFFFSPSSPVNLFFLSFEGLKQRNSLFFGLALFLLLIIIIIIIIRKRKEKSFESSVVEAGGIWRGGKRNSLGRE